MKNTINIMTNPLFSRLSLKPFVVFTVVFMLTVFPAPGSTPYAEEFESSDIRTVQVIGSGIVISSDVAQARDRAVSNGLVSAVSKVAWELLPLKGMVDYFQELNQTLFSNSNAYVQDYKVLAESVTGNSYRVVLEASIPVNVLRKRLADAGFIQSQKTLPTVLFLVSEQLKPDSFPRFWWGNQDSIFYTAISEGAMTQVMNESGFTITSHQNPNIINKLSSLTQDCRLPDEDAVLIGKNTDAQILIVGEAWVEKSPNVMGTDKRTFKGIVSIRAIRVDTGEVIARIRQTSLVVDTEASNAGERALSQAGTLAGNAMSSRIAAIWNTSSAAYPGQISIVVEGTNDLADFVYFRKLLKEISDVKSIFIKEMKPDESVILVDYRGTPESLAKALMLNTYTSFGINIYEIGPDVLRIRLVKN